MNKVFKKVSALFLLILMIMSVSTNLISYAADSTNINKDDTTKVTSTSKTLTNSNNTTTSKTA